MAAVLHGSARTTPRVRAELQAAQASSRALAPSAVIPSAAPLEPWTAPPNTASTPKPS